MTPDQLTRNTWYIVYSKENQKVVGEIVFTSYDKTKDSLVVSHAIPSALKKICVESVLKGASKYEYRGIDDLKYPKGHVHARSPFYMRSWDGI